MKPSRIQAVDTVNLEAPPGIEAELLWCYRDLIGLAELGAAQEGHPVLRFRSGGVELRIHIVGDPKAVTMEERMAFAVPSLAEAQQALEERRMPFWWQRGLDWPDECIVMYDPAGNRVALKREWPALPF